MLGRLSAAFEMAVDDGKLPRNPCRKVRVSGGAKAPRATWNEDQVKRFITAVSADRLASVWLLSLLGLRRGEVCGLRWADISFTDATLSIRTTHVTVGGEVIEKGPKSRRGYRTLPMFKAVSGALLALYETQVAEKDAAGAAYAGDVDDGFVCCDELGQPVHPEWWSSEFGRLCKAAGLPRIRLHDCRHSTNSLLEHLGVTQHQGELVRAHDRRQHDDLHPRIGR
jgi:integrase